MGPFKVLDLFSGCGGFSLGFKQAGFEISGCVDKWGDALETLEENKNGVGTFKKDLRNAGDSFFEKFADVDAVTAGPPCQGFSMVGTRDPDDDRNNLFKEVIRAAEIISPEVLVIENVPGLLSMTTPDGREVKDVVINEIEGLGYKCNTAKLTASDYGVPQNRERVFFLAHKKGYMDFPDPVTGDPVTVGDALGNLPKAGENRCGEPECDYQKKMTRDDRKVFNHKKINHGERVVKRMSFVPQGGNWRDVPDEYYQVGGKHSNNYRRLDSDEPSITIKHATKSMIIHPEFDRGLTVREVARIQSFPDDFVFKGAKSSQHQQLANAVPPLLSYHLAEHIKKYLKGRKEIRKYRGNRNEKRLTEF